MSEQADRRPLNPAEIRAALAKAMQGRRALPERYPADFDWIVDDLEEALAEIERLRGLLKRLEWEGSVYAYQAGGPVPVCPACKEWRTLGQHAPDCWLAAEL